MKSDLPNSSQLSPEQTPLPELLQLVKTYQPQREAIRREIARAFFPHSKDSLELANNTVLALSEYGLLYKPREDQTRASLTDLGEQLALLVGKNDNQGLYDTFARHILLHLRGLDLLGCAADLVAAGQKPTKQAIVRELRRRGIYHEPILDAVEQAVGIQYRTLIRMPYDLILKNLKSESSHEKGLALEALAFYLARLLMLDFVQWRLRSRQAGSGRKPFSLPNRLCAKPTYTLPY